MRYYFTPTRIANTQSRQTTAENHKHWRGCELNRTLGAAGGNGKWCRCHGTHSTVILHKIQQGINYHIVQPLHFWVYNQNN